MHLARAGGQQPGQHAQQRGLAAAVAAVHLQRLARRQREVERAEHRLVVAREGQAAAFQEGGRGGIHGPAIVNDRPYNPH
jgi:hypothetical protein